jgi:hypothetical protein
MARKSAAATAIVYGEFSLFFTGAKLKTGADYSKQIEDAAQGMIELQALIGRMQAAQGRTKAVAGAKSTRTRKGVNTPSAIPTEAASEAAA